jgi:hypothetical protein
MRYRVDYEMGDYDIPEQYTVQDTKTEVIVARVHVTDFRAKAPVHSDFIETKKRLIHAELRALDHAKMIAEKLDEASINSEI